MTSLSLNQFLLLYMWFVIAALVFFMLLIARFYQNFSGDRTLYLWYVLPIVAFASFAARYSSLDRLAGDLLGDALSAIAGAVLLLLCLRLYHQMTVGRE